MANGGEVIFKFLGDDKELKKTMGDLGKIGKTALKGMVAGTTAVAVGFGAIVTASVKARGEMEQLEGGVKKIFDEMDYAQIEKDAVEAYKTMNLSASEYMQMINSVGATFSATMGDQKGYETAKRGLQAIADYASGTGEDVNQLNEKYKLISRSTTSYLRIADQFSSILPQTTESFLKQAQASGFLSDSYKKLTDVPVAEYQDAVTKMIEQGVDKMNLLGNTAKESTETLTGSLAMTKKSWENFLSGKGSLSDFVDSAGIAFDKILSMVEEILPQISEQIKTNLPKIMEIGGKIINSLCDGIIEFLPEILDMVVIIVDKMSSALLDNSDKLGEIAFDLMSIFAQAIISALPYVLLAIGKIGVGMIDAIAEFQARIKATAITLIIRFAEGILNAMPKAIQNVVNILRNIISTIGSWNRTIHQKAKELIHNFAEGIGSAISWVTNKIGQIKDAIFRKIQELISGAYSWGSDFIHNFASGITSGLTNLNNKVTNMANSIKSKLHFSRPDEGPLRDYETWMPDMIKGMAKSLEKASPILTSKIKALSSEMAMSLSPTLNGGAYSYSPSMSVVVNNNIETDPLGQMVSKIKTFSNGAKNDYNYGYGG